MFPFSDCHLSLLKGHHTVGKHKLASYPFYGGHYNYSEMDEQWFFADSNKNQESGIRNQESEIRNQKSEIRNQKSEIRNQKSESAVIRTATFLDIPELPAHQNLPDYYL